MSKKWKGHYVPLIRKQVYYDANPIEINDEAGEYRIKGTMGNDHMPTVKISLFPTKMNKLAPSVKPNIELNIGKKKDLASFSNHQIC